jgi:hypothetical protein
MFELEVWAKAQAGDLIRLWCDGVSTDKYVYTFRRAEVPSYSM